VSVSESDASVKPEAGLMRSWETTARKRARQTEASPIVLAKHRRQDPIAGQSAAGATNQNRIPVATALQANVRPLTRAVQCGADLMA
jgi:hypothetical protein